MSNIVYKKMSKVTRDLRNLKPSSIKQYKKNMNSILHHVYNTSLEKEYEAERKPLNLLKEDLDKFYDWIKEKSLASQSTYLSAAIFYTSPRARNVALPGYEHLLDELQVKFKEVSDKKFNKKLNKKSEKENANWCTLKELNKIRID